MADDTRTWTPPDPTPREAMALVVVIAASVEAPERTGEVSWLPERGEATLGRRGDLAFGRSRPTSTVPTGPLSDPHLSRDQLRFIAASGRAEIENIGRLPLRLNGLPVDRAPIGDGDLLTLGDRVLLLVQERPRRPTERQVNQAFAFGGPDDDHWVGEGPASWALRAEVTFTAPRPVHVLIGGESGSGKELVAHALHAHSARGKLAMVSRSAATIPSTLADAELFGNLANYPNPGMIGRPGLVGEADGSTLFLDEFGELPTEVQARLLRVLDDGEYTRLGEARARRSNLRLVAATNRDVSALKHDVAARFPIRFLVPPLRERREDIPLIAFHLLRRIAKEDRVIARRLFPAGDPAGTPRIGVALMERLVSHAWPANVRELEATLWAALRKSDGPSLDVWPDSAPARGATPAPAIDPSSVGPEVIQAALDRHDGRQEPVWRELGLASRHVLARLVKRYGLKVRGRGGE